MEIREQKVRRIVQVTLYLGGEKAHQTQGWQKANDPKDGKTKERRWSNLKEGKILQPEEKLRLRRDNALRSRR